MNTNCIHNYEQKAQGAGNTLPKLGIDRALDGQASQLAALVELYAALTKRLYPVLSSDKVAAETKPDNYYIRNAADSPLGSRIEDHTCEINQLVRGIEDLLRDLAI